MMSATTGSSYAKPLPQIEPEARRYWESLKAHAMEIQRCSDCGRWYFPPRTLCPGCSSSNVAWKPVSGNGRVYAVCNFFHSFHPAYGRDELPYNVSIVELDEGPRLVTNVVGCPTDDVQIGMPVAVVYADVTEDITLAKFRPA